MNKLWFTKQKWAVSADFPVGLVAAGLLLSAYLLRGTLAFSIFLFLYRLRRLVGLAPISSSDFEQQLPSLFAGGTLRQRLPALPEAECCADTAQQLPLPAPACQQAHSEMAIPVLSLWLAESLLPVVVAFAHQLVPSGWSAGHDAVLHAVKQRRFDRLRYQGE